MSIDEVVETANKLAWPGRGILAADESTGTIGKRLTSAGLENTEDTRRRYRQIFVTADGIGEHLSGAILFRETLSQVADDGVSFVDHLRRQGIVPGVKVDEGLEEIPGCAPETHTKGLGTLDANCANYYAQGARFAKWRAALRVGPGMPSVHAAQVNAEELASYASVCQARGLCPIVEPEVLIEGDHSAERFAEASQMVIAECVKALWAKNVVLKGCLIKPQMVVPGEAFAGPNPSPRDVAQMTLDVLRRTVPAAVPGIMFLSGGQSEELATCHLDAINCLAREQGRAPWSLSFSFGRALQASVLNIWAADQSRVPEAQAMAVALARANAMAARGAWASSGERHPSPSGASLVETFRGHTAH